MGVRIEAPKQDGNARFNSLKVNLQENLSAPRNVVADNDGNIYYGTVSGGSGFPFSGSAQITGSLGVTGSINVTNGGITGSLYGTSSWAVSASFVANSPTADTASYVTSSNVHGPFGPNSILSASYSVSSSYSKTSSYAVYSETASFVTASSVFGPFGSNSVLSASYAVSTSYTNYAITASHALTASSADNFLVRGTLTAQTIVAQVITSSTEYITGSTIFGSQLTDTHQFTGSVSITGSLTVNNDSVVTLQQLNQATASLSSSIGYLSGSFLEASASFDTRINNLSSSLYSLSASFLSFSSSYNTGSFSGSFTGNLTGTASWATNFITSSVTSASFAQTASYVLNAVSSSYAYTASSAVNSTNALTASFVQNAQSASYVLNAVSSSYAFTASSAISASRSDTSISSSYAYTASSAVNSFNAVSSSYAYTASSAISASRSDSSISSSYAFTASSAVNAFNSISASYAFTASSAINSFNAISSSYAFTASSAISASQSNNATNALTASFVQNAQSASYVLNAISSSYSFTASSAVNSFNAVSASYAFTASSAISASRANTAISSSYAETSSLSNLAITASHALSLPTNINISASNIFVTSDLTVQGTASFGFIESVTGSAIIVGQEYIILNTQVPASRYAGLIVYDSGSNATASIVWDSVRNHLIYQNSSGSGYTGGGFLSGPRNTGSLGDETYPTLNRVVRGQGGDHLYDSNITDDDIAVSIAINTRITGSLLVTQGITGSLFGTASWATNFITSSVTSASYAFTASSAVNSFNAVSASYAFTASSATNSFNSISASYAFTASSAISASRASTAISSSYAFTASSAISASRSDSTISSSYAYTASSATNAFNSISASYAYTASSAISSFNAISASYAYTASSAINSTNALTASYVLNAVSASYAFTASSAINSFNAVSASYAYTASSAINSFNSVSSSYAFTASSAISASRSDSSISASYAFTASSAVNSFNAVSASYAYTASSAVNATNAINSINAQTASSADNFLVRQSITASNALINGTITAQTLVVSTVSSSVVYSSGSNIFGNSLTNVQQFTGSVRMTGSLTVIGRATITDLTGSLFGTASWATNFITSSVTSASYAFTASSAVNSFNAISSSYAFTASSAVNSFNAISASYAFTASSAINSFNAVSSSYAFTASSATNAFNAISSSYAFTASSAINSFNAVSASYAFTASSAISSSFALSSISASYAFTASSAISASRASTSISSSYSFTASSAISASRSDTSISSSYAFTASSAVNSFNAISASYAFTASSAVNSFNAVSSSFATQAISASYVLNAISASYSFTASSAVNSFNAISASYAFTASSAVNAFNSISASSALTASRALTASYVDPLIQTVYISGSLGIGTPTPTQKLELRDAAVALTLTPQTYTGSYRTSLGSRASAEGHLVLGNNGTNYIQAGTTAVGGTLSIYVNSTNDVNTAINGVMAMYFKADGNIGIGTTAPAATLHVVKDGGAGTIRLLRLDNSNATYAQNVYLDMNTSKDILWSQGSVNGGTFWDSGTRGYGFSINATRIVTIEQTGNIGIGTATPSVSVHVLRSTNATIGFRAENSIGTGGDAFSTFQAGSDFTNNRFLNIGYANPGVVLSGAYRPTGSFIVSNGNGGLNFLATGSDGATHIRFFTSAATVGGVERMIIQDGGNVGIGTSTPTLAKLQVQGNVWAQSFTGSFSGSITSPGSNTQVIYNNSGVLAGSNNFIFDGTNVGIGTTSALDKLRVFGSAGDPNGVYIQVYNSFNGSAKSGIKFVNEYGGNVYSGSIYSNWFSQGIVLQANRDLTDSQGGFEFHTTTGTAVLVIRTSSGNVGIGTTTASQKLEVQGPTQVGNDNVLVSSLIFARKNTNQARANYYISSNDSPTQTWYEGALGTAENAGVSYAALRPYYESMIPAAGVKSFGFVNATSGSSFGASALTSSLVMSYTGLIYMAHNGGNVGIGTTNATLAKLQVQGNVWAQSLTGSLFGTASWAQNFITGSVTSASYAFTASSAVNATNALTASSADNFLVRQSITASNALINGTITAQTLVVSTVSSSVVYSSGSNIFGNQLTNVQQFTGSLRVTGSGDHWILGGYVGINTPTPATDLEVRSNSNTIMRISTTLGSGYAQFETDGVNGAFSSNNDFLIYTRGSARVIVSGSLGNVGIGTLTPTLAKLQVQGNVWAQSFTGSFSGSISSPGSNTQVIYNNAGVLAGSNNFVFNGTNVGIGYTSPTNKLHIGISNAAHTNEGISFDSPSGFGGAGIYHDYSATSPITNFKIVNTYSDSRINLAQDSYNAAGSPGHIGFFTQANGGGGTAIERVRIISTGNVGIGSISPLVKLDVSGSVALAGTDGLRIGAVGDNSAYDNVKLYYTGYSAGSPRVYLTPRTTPGSGVVETYFHLLNTNGSSTTSNNTMGLLVDGNTAIGGVSSINARLHVSSSTGGVFRLDGVNGASILYASASGNIGIGTTSPLTLLHVNGVASASAVSASSFTGDSYYGRAYTTFTDAGGGVAYFDTVTTSGAKLYEVSIIANPNSGGSSAYRDLLYGKIIIGTGWNGSAVTDFISYVQENPDPRSLYSSGGGSLTVVARMVSGGTEYDQLATGTSYTIRIKVSGYSVTGTSTTVRLKQIM